MVVLIALVDPNRNEYLLLQNLSCVYLVLSISIVEYHSRYWGNIPTLHIIRISPDQPPHWVGGRDLFVIIRSSSNYPCQVKHLSVRHCSIAEISTNRTECEVIHCQVQSGWLGLCPVVVVGRNWPTEWTNYQLRILQSFIRRQNV